MKRKLAWVCLLVSPLVLGGAVLFFLPRDPITQANCDKIKRGMKLKEVIALLGKKYPDEPGKNLWATIRKYRWGPTSCVWVGVRGRIIVSFQTFRDPWEEYEDGFRFGPVVQEILYLTLYEDILVERAQFLAREQQSVIEKIENWLGL